MNAIDLNARAEVVHQANIKWWQNVHTGEPIERNRCELVALIISELSEALEGERKNLMDDKLPHRRMAEVEMADAYIRVLDFAGGFGIHIDDDQYPDIGPMTDEGNRAESIWHIMRAASGLGYRRPHDTSIIKVIHMIEHYCAFYGYDLEGAYAEKMAFNAVREDHTHEARKAAGGKQF